MSHSPTACRCRPGHSLPPWIRHRTSAARGGPLWAPWIPGAGTTLENRSRSAFMSSRMYQKSLARAMGTHPSRSPGRSAQPQHLGIGWVCHGVPKYHGLLEGEAPAGHYLIHFLGQYPQFLQRVQSSGGIVQIGFLFFL
jgi:hypothetical protein